MKRKKRWVSGRSVVIPMLSLAMLQPAVYVGAESGNTVFISAQTVSAVQGEVIPANPENVKVTKEEAIEKIRELFPMLKDAQVSEVELGDSHVYPPPANQMVWNIGWHYQKGNSGYGFNSRVDAMTGELISTHIGFPMDEENVAYYPPKVSREEALKKAEAFIKKAAPSLSNVKEKPLTYFTNQPLFGQVRHTFQFERTVQGIPVPEESIYMTVDGEGRIIEFNRQASIGEYPIASPTITAEQALKKYQDHLDLALHYIPLYRGGENTVFLGWKPAASYSVIDAMTGEFLSPTGQLLNKESVIYEEIPKDAQAFKPSGKQITAEEAAAIVQKVGKIPEGRTLQGKSLGSYRGNQEQSVWNLTFRDNTQGYFGPESETFAAVDAKTGQILEFEENRFGRPGSLDETEKPNEVEAKKRAIELIQQLYPNASEDLKLLNTNSMLYYPAQENTVSFVFQRFYKGIPVEGDTVNITLNAKGQIVRLYTNQTPDLAGKVKGLPAKISKEEAMKRYLQDTSVQLNFLRVGEPWSPEGAANSEIKLVYQQTFKDGLHSGFAIDANDGKWKSGWDPSGDAQHQAIEPQDIKGHWAEASLQTLLRYQIIKPDEKGQLNPDLAITRGEWLDMMVKSVDPYYDQVYNDPQASEWFEDVKKDHAYYPAARWARERDWIDAKERKLGLDQVLTREDLAVSLTHIVNYDKLAKLMDADEIAFTDAAQIKAKGAVSIIARLGLMKGLDGKFNPTGQVTKAQAATVLMELVKLQGKTDFPIGQIRY